MSNDVHSTASQSFYSSDDKASDSLNDRQSTSSGKSDTADTSSPLSVIQASQQAVEDVVESVEQERHPRWRILQRGRAWIPPVIFGLLALTVLAIAAHSFSILPGDLPFTREFQESRNPLLTGLMSGVSFLGTGLAPVIITVLALLVFWILRLRLEAVFLALGLLADLLGFALKVLVGRHRPAPSIVYVAQHLNDPSFPSGHTLHYTVFYGFLAFVVAVNYRNCWRRNFLLGLFLALIALVGPSRIYLGEHWLSDVVGGYLLGGVCLLLLIAGYLGMKERYEVLAGPP